MIQAAIKNKSQIKRKRINTMLKGLLKCIFFSIIVLDKLFESDCINQGASEYQQNIHTAKTVALKLTPRVLDLTPARCSQRTAPTGVT